MLKVVSFDMDGTLIVKNFADAVWFEGVPRLYAERWGVPLEDALERVKRAYDEVGPGRLEWYELGYWFKRFDLPGSWRELLARYRRVARPYPDVKGVLAKLKRKYRLIVVSAAAREFVDLGIKGNGLDRFFERTFSAVSDFGVIGKQPELFKRVCAEIGIAPEELLHVGDDPIYDLEMPRRVGAKSLLLDRECENRTPWTIHSLRELPERLGVQ
jgi:putative hydrolase of the HAD superfamily